MENTILSNGQFKLLFDDTTGVLTIRAGANKMVFSDADKSISIADMNGNSIKMSAAGIEIKSASDIKITAANNVTTTATNGMLSEKGADGVTVSGLKIALSADTDLSAKGTATASLSSGGQTIVKGAMVMIN